MESEGSSSGAGGRRCQPANPHLGSMDSDYLYHIGYASGECELFRDVKFVITGGCPRRMENFAKLLSKEIGKPCENITKEGSRFSFFKIGPVLSINHGMGVPSISIMLHEILKLLHYAKAEDPIILRLGTSGGLGVEPGTVVVANKTFNAFLQEKHQVVILGKVTSRDAVIDQELAQEIASCSGDVPTVLSGTMCTDEFYEGQARMDGAVSEISEEEKMTYLRRVKEAGISNIEMECTAIASLCNKTGVKCAVVCVTLLDRLKGDQVVIKPEQYKEFSQRPQTVLARFIKTRLGIGQK